MNWHIDNDGTLTVDQAENEKDAQPSASLIEWAEATVSDARKRIKGKTHAEVHGHQTTKGRGFKPEHFTITVSNVDPKA